MLAPKNFLSTPEEVFGEGKLFDKEVEEKTRLAFRVTMKKLELVKDRFQPPIEKSAIGWISNCLIGFVASATPGPLCYGAHAAFPTSNLSAIRLRRRRRRFGSCSAQRELHSKCPLRNPLIHPPEDPKGSS